MNPIDVFLWGLVAVFCVVGITIIALETFTGDFRFWKWPGQIRFLNGELKRWIESNTDAREQIFELNTKIQNTDGIASLNATANREKIEMQNRYEKQIDELKRIIVDKSDAISALKHDFVDELEKVTVERGDLLKRCELLERLSSSLPSDQIEKPQWTGSDEAFLEQFLKSEAGAKLLKTLQALEQANNRAATDVPSDCTFNAGTAKGFRLCMIEIIQLCGQPKPENKATTSDEPPKPDSVAETYMA